MEEVKRKMQIKPILIDIEKDEKSHQDSGSRPSRAAKWAKMWREQHNAKLIAKRERKQVHQMLGLHQLQKEMEELEEEKE